MLIIQTVQEYVDFVVNAPYPRVLELLGEASIGLNTMVDEHFGINVVEFMVGTNCPNAIDTKECLMGLLLPSIQAAGVIPIVHASGGPLHDIVVPVDGQRTGMCHPLCPNLSLLLSCILTGCRR